MNTMTYFISTGAKNAMFTLWVETRDAKGRLFSCVYIRNLASEQDRAVENAITFINSISDRFADKDVEVSFDPNIEEDVIKRRGKLSVADTLRLEDIDRGIFPFGKHYNTKIADAPEGYLLWMTDQLSKNTDMGVVMAALCQACASVAFDKGYIAKRDEKRKEIREQNEKSNFVGQVGQRSVFEGEVISSFYKDMNDGYGFWINKLRVGEDIVSYLGGKSLGERGTNVKVKATIKEHKEYNGIKETQVSRPFMMA